MANVRHTSVEGKITINEEGTQISLSVWDWNWKNIRFKFQLKEKWNILSVMPETCEEIKTICKDWRFKR